MIFFGKTDIGKKRATNQDSFSVGRMASGEILGVLCDGMGGANGGNVASAAAAEAFVDYMETALTAYASLTSQSTTVKKQGRRRNSINYASLLQSAADAANDAVFRRANEEALLAGMGTTLVAALISGDNLYIANVGDSRLYLMQSGNVKQITRDHSYVQYLVDIGRITSAEAEVSPYKNIITRAVGREETIEADIFTIALSSGKNKNTKEDIETYILMCSDGLTNFLSHERISEIIYTDSVSPQNENSELEDKVNRLIVEANEAGGGDNITAVLIKKQ